MDIKQLIGSAIETIIKIVIAVFLVMFVYDTVIKAYDYGYRVFAEEPMTAGEGRTISISVGEGDSVRDIGNNLEEKGLIRDGNLFFIQELLSEYHGDIKPGIYDLNTSMTSAEMMEIMSAEPEEEEEGASTDNVPIQEAEPEGAEGTGDADGAAGAEGSDDADGAAGAEGTGDADGAAGAESTENGAAGSEGEPGA